MSNWVSIYTSPKQQEAEIIRALLTHNEIPSVVINRQDSFYKFGDFEVFVNRNDVVKAKFCITKNSTK